MTRIELRMNLFALYLGILLSSLSVMGMDNCIIDLGDDDQKLSEQKRLEEKLLELLNYTQTKTKPNIMVEYNTNYPMMFAKYFGSQNFQLLVAEHMYFVEKREILAREQELLKPAKFKFLYFDEKETKNNNKKPSKQNQVTKSDELNEYQTPESKIAFDAKRLITSDEAKKLESEVWNFTYFMVNDILPSATKDYLFSRCGDKNTTSLALDHYLEILSKPVFDNVIRAQKTKRKVSGKQQEKKVKNKKIETLENVKHWMKKNNTALGYTKGKQLNQNLSTLERFVLIIAKMIDGGMMTYNERFGSSDKKILLGMH